MGFPKSTTKSVVEWIKFYQTLMNDGSAHPTRHRGIPAKCVQPSSVKGPA